MSRPRRTDSGHKMEMKIRNRHSSAVKSQMEGIMNFVAEWFSREELKALQGVCVLTSVWARERQYRDILINFDGQVWKDVSDEWQKYLLEKEESPAL